MELIWILEKLSCLKEGAFLELTAAFGGIEIHVPEHWRVVVKGMPIFGAWENKAESIRCWLEKISLYSTSNVLLCLEE